MELFRKFVKEQDEPTQNLDDADQDISSLVGGGDEQQLSAEPELDSMLDKAATEDPNKQGLIRTIPGAHLVYKRQSSDGNFEELWLYNVNELQKELDIRKAILAGTDIPTNKTESPDGKQTYELWSAGNAEIMCIKGLVN